MKPHSELSRGSTYDYCLFCNSQYWLIRKNIVRFWNQQTLSVYNLRGSSSTHKNKGNKNILSNHDEGYKERKTSRDSISVQMEIIYLKIAQFPRNKVFKIVYDVLSAFITDETIQRSTSSRTKRRAQWMHHYPRLPNCVHVKRLSQKR